MHCKGRASPSLMPTEGLPALPSPLLMPGLHVPFPTSSPRLGEELGPSAHTGGSREELLLRES